MATMYWRTAGNWDAPVIVMAACGAYRPGLGPYHAQTAEGTMAHIPGLDVFMPSTAADAAGMLNAAFESRRPTIFLYPKAILNDSRVATSDDVAEQFAPIGPARKVRGGRDITFVAWGNTVRICEEVAEALERVGAESDIIDLRSLSPWDERSVLASAERTARLVVVHEDNYSCGVGAEVLASVAEKGRVPVACRRVARPDTYIPCHFGNQIELLPSFQSVLQVAAELLDLDLQWIETRPQLDDVMLVDAIGSGPSDDRVEVVQWHISEGDTVRRGDALVALEASKSVFDMTSTMDGTIERLLAAEGDNVPVGEPLLKLRCDPDSTRPQAKVDEAERTPVLKPKPKSGRLILPRSDDESRQFDVGISNIATV